MTLVGQQCGPGPAGIAPEAIRVQVERILASAEMRNSRRCQLFLRHVVDAALDGSAEPVKERTVGVAVFGRAPDYNTNEDTVVRHAAIEVRKRLAQYYQAPGREHEVRIVLPPGGYVPEFHPAVDTLAVEARRPPRPGRWRGDWLVAVAALAVLTCGSGWWYHTSASRSDLDRFWAPFVDGPAGVVLCVGQPTRVYRFVGPRATELHDKVAGTSSDPPLPREALTHTPLTLGDIAPSGQRFVYFGDTLCVSKIHAMLAKKGKSVQIRGEAMTPFQDLRGRPVVLIGLSNNQWTPRLTTDLRFHLENNFEARHYELRDRARPGKIVAIVDSGSVDYAIVNRIFDPSTEGPMVSAAGTTHLGTLAAGDFLTSEVYMREAFRKVPRGWHRQNVQVVLRTRIVGGMAGPPEVVALHIWSWGPPPAPIRAEPTPPTL